KSGLVEIIDVLIAFKDHTRTLTVVCSERHQRVVEQIAGFLEHAERVGLVDEFVVKRVTVFEHKLRNTGGDIAYPLQIIIDLYKGQDKSKIYSYGVVQGDNVLTLLFNGEF